MADVLEETTAHPIDKAHVESRVEDWARRIDDLYAALQSWLPPGYSARQSSAVPMHEELMRKFGVPVRKLPTLELLRGGQPLARLEPRGLWIIGANGRVDFHVGSDHYVIVDSAENFAEANWQIAPFSDRRKLVALTQESFTSKL